MIDRESDEQPIDKTRSKKPDLGEYLTKLKLKNLLRGLPCLQENKTHA